mgnify:CR=1 FL=1
MRVWTFANQKGGVGKTTSSIALAGLAADEGKRVVMVDLDPHGSLTSYFGLDPDATEAGVLTLFHERKTMDKALVSGAIVATQFPNLNVMPASTALATLERQVIAQDGMGLVISRALQLIADDYDLVVIDCPPQLGVLMINALAACNLLIMPVQTEFLALKGLERMQHTLVMLNRSRKQALQTVVLPTMFDRRTQASVSSLRTLRHTYGADVWPGKIPIDTKFRDASKAGVPPHRHAPQSRGVEAYSSLYQWLQKAQVVSNTAANVSQR